MIAKLKRDNADLQREYRALRPSTAPGILTNRTTRGVTRRPIRRDTGSSRNSNDGTARWA
jgi:hypothetical protein